MSRSGGAAALKVTDAVPVVTPCPPLRSGPHPLSPSPFRSSPPVPLSVPVLTPCPPLRSGEGGLRASPEHLPYEGFEAVVHIALELDDDPFAETTEVHNEA